MLYSATTRIKLAETACQRSVTTNFYHVEIVVVTREKNIVLERIFCKILFLAFKGDVVTWNQFFHP